MPPASIQVLPWVTQDPSREGPAAPLDVHCDDESVVVLNMDELKARHECRGGHARR
jgi:hypothetical protein